MAFSRVCFPAAFPPSVPRFPAPFLRSSFRLPAFFSVPFLREIRLARYLYRGIDRYPSEIGRTNAPGEIALFTFNYLRVQLAINKITASDEICTGACPLNFISPSVLLAAIRRPVVHFLAPFRCSRSSIAGHKFSLVYGPAGKITNLAANCWRNLDVASGIVRR